MERLKGRRVRREAERPYLVIGPGEETVQY